MVETTKLTPQSIPAGRIPFACALSLAIALLLVLTAWAATDASFRIAAWKARLVLNFEPVPSADPLGIVDAMQEIRRDALGIRVIALYVVFIAGSAAIVACCWLTLRRPAARRVACTLAMLGTCGVLYAKLDAIQDWRARRHALALLPSIEKTAVALHEQWPARSGQIPPDLEVNVSPDRYPDVLTIRGRRPSHPFSENLGLMITRGRDGIIRFDLAAAHDSTIEFHPHGTQPVKYVSGFGNPSPTVASIIPLKENWYLARYGGE